MTTTIKVTSHNYPARVTTTDRGENADGSPYQNSSTRILRPADGEQQFYCTTSRTIEVVDLEYDAPEAQ